MNWIHLNTYPYYQELDQDLLDLILEDQNPALLLFVADDSEGHELRKFFEEHYELYYENYFGGRLFS